MSAAQNTIDRRGGIPRGIARSGPAVLSYGFRPFFLGAGVFALLAMSLWIGSLTQGWTPGGEYGALNWHAHEMLFGYTSAALAGFMLTAIPNWTGRLPVSGLPLLALVGLWLAGRLAMGLPQVIGLVPSIVVDLCFLPVLAAIAGREIVAGRNWKNLKVLGALMALSLANAAFHWSVVTDGAAPEASRATVGIYVVLIALIGGRIVPSFTRNFMARAGSTLPKPFGRFDVVAIVALVPAFAAWVIMPDGPISAALAIVAAGLHLVRLWRWRGWATLEEPLLAMLHVAYLFVPLGLVCVALSALSVIAIASALHVLTVGAIGGTTLAVMTRANLGHTGRPLHASVWTALAYGAILVAAIVRPFAEIFPDAYHPLLALSGACWLMAFGIFVFEYGPMLLTRRA